MIHPRVTFLNELTGPVEPVRNFTDGRILDTEKAMMGQSITRINHNAVDILTRQIKAAR